MSWWKDRSLWTAACFGLVIRAVPLLVWPGRRCTRDECTYLKIAKRMLDGEGMTTSGGWLWAPGYPTLMAIHKWITGYGATIRATQVLAGFLTTWLVYRLAQRMFVDEADPRSIEHANSTARIAAWLYAASPVMAFFTMSMWSESLYGALLLGLLLVLCRITRLHEEPRPIRMAALAGFLAGCCVLFRGVATYMVPIFAFGLLWRRWKQSRAWAQAGALVAAALLTVSPYSIYASTKFEAFIVSDRTLGQMMWLGNNDFEPLTFDFGNGQLSKRAYARHIADGRPHCAPRKQGVERDDCATKEGIEWIRANPQEFVRRMPMRLAQMLTPHSLLTRHLRWGRWKGMPQVADEFIVLWGALWSMFVMVGGTLGLAARGRGAMGLTIAALLCYHGAAVSALAGLSRYRVPLEPLWMLYAAMLLADPRGTLSQLRTEPWRGAVAIVSLCVVMPLVLWYLPAGWTWWRSW
ncbi:MAG: glycosyltransferase family 39 protein [Myxococcota bacterium]|nr:glycosyltransferase family 39 protein [Myxococcota bacterium]